MTVAERETVFNIEDFTRAYIPVSAVRRMLLDESVVPLHVSPITDTFDLLLTYCQDTFPESVVIPEYREGGTDAENEMYFTPFGVKVILASDSTQDLRMKVHEFNVVHGVTELAAPLDQRFDDGDLRMLKIVLSALEYEMYDS